ncbi:hypothetical protein CCH79_00020774, partial [Gambusia affinis]
YNSNINFTSYCAEAVNVRNQSGNLFQHLVLDVTQTLCTLNMFMTPDFGLLTGAGVLWWIGLVLATIHIWNLNTCRIQKTQDLFVRRLYEGALIEQSLLLNTRFHIQCKNRRRREGKIPAMVYLCATMWLETYEEMMNIMISVFRLDQYRPKSLTQLHFDDFNFEAHIYFDDAFTNVTGSQHRHLNTYAKDLVKIIADVYGIFKNLDKTFFEVQQQTPDQAIIKTPYGARLVVEMPHGNNIVVHFKDKQKIRNKKRWSQVMYLYYLLGWKLMTKYYRYWQEGQHEKHLKRKIQKEKHNTYILALDGDTDFQPAAVMLLIDRLKMYPRHVAEFTPLDQVGTDENVSFFICGTVDRATRKVLNTSAQKFEYAISHWLQKTAEHVFGSVLCSPGCFSLFRAEALMDDNVMKKYSTNSTEPSHYIQYDQDCCRLTSALQMTLSPSRKRWGPSTMANIVDLLGSTNIVSKRNLSMSKLFMFYQLFGMISTILAPSTICLMVAGSLSFIFEIPSAAALVIAVIPPAIYLGLCFKLKTDTQISLAGILSVIYAFLMVVVAISIIASMVKVKTILTPSSIFVVAMSIIYIVTALLHPQELPLLFYGLLYIICIPSAYLLLTIYSMVNMNSVSWGTRETKPTADDAPTAVSALQAKTNKAKSIFQRFLSWMKCKKSLPISEDTQPLINAQPQENLMPESVPEPQTQDTAANDVSEKEPMQMKTGWANELESLSNDIQLQEHFLERDEENFWNELIKKYLEPVKNDKEKQEKTKNDLKELRNKVNFSFFFLNALWLMAAFIFQVFDVFSLKINIVGLNLQETGGTIQIEPMSLMFILGFAISVLLQFIGMLRHRVSTLIHYIAFLETEPKKQKSADHEVDSTADSNDEYNTDLNYVTQENLSSQDWESEFYNSNLNIQNIQEDFV